MNNLYYLSHGGPGSGRYPWGSGDRPYQRLEKGKKRFSLSGYIKSRKAKKLEAKQQKAASEEIKRRLEEAEKKRELAANKERVIRSGTATEVMSYKGKITNQELQYAVDRLRLEDQLSSYSQKEVKTALNKMKTIQAYTNVGSALAKDGIVLYNSLASIYNATEDGRKKPLTLVNAGGGGGKK